MGEPEFVLRDGRRVTIDTPQLGDIERLPRLLEAAADPRGKLVAGTCEQRSGDPTVRLAANSLPDGDLVGYAAWVGAGGARGEFVCAVDRALTGLGLGTLLLRTAAVQATQAGLSRLRVELHPQARGLAAMLRDCGLRSSWDLEHPVTRVELVLGAERPGWATPKPAVRERARERTLHSIPPIR